MKIAEYLRVDDPPHLWPLMRQCGVDHAVLRLPEAADGTMPSDLAAVRTAVERVEKAGFAVEAIEPIPPMEKVKQGLPGRDEEIEHVHHLLATMERLGVQILCYNFMAAFGWGRTRWAEPGRGEALVTGFDVDDLEALPAHDVALSEDRMWANYEYFVRAVVPVAERHGIRLAMHPDDPPVSPYRGVARIMRTPEAIERAMSLSDSPAHGLTFCQGTFSTMGADIPATIRRFADRIRFVHFRDVRGTPDRFVETFHDEGQTDMRAAMAAYAEIGFDGPLRPDHVPTLFGEPHDRPGYEVLGRLYAVGYLRGLWEAVAHPTDLEGDRDDR
ncbi:mannonate dehydratase [Jiangella sp. DSM 45060]|uniref:mannonate dehydratase n=1 Tax=Jiangella sp. DSM 45060 TaxID=1798224 RepID=UPI00087C31EE|nr:mannonate dehydratase [Jiangella sp. DSM 45060]SDS45614.1 mannonate dehydratase [Jiangella sp. DSM 45060]